MELQILIETLEKSVEKNGEKPLTNLWLLNIMKLVETQIEHIEQQSELIGSAFDWDD